MQKRTQQSLIKIRKLIENNTVCNYEAGVCYMISKAGKTQRPHLKCMLKWPILGQVALFQEVLQTLTKFCFPFYVDSLTVSQVGQNFTFVLTDIDSKQRFGFCRLSSGAKSCFCILRIIASVECAEAGESAWLRFLLLLSGAVRN
uniref:uDENN domain-containing protein n=1 Tax=Capra hircus TaxID=9925 RepID=A0A8C2R1W1_CAPHI